MLELRARTKPRSKPSFKVSRCKRLWTVCFHSCDPENPHGAARTHKRVTRCPIIKGKRKNSGAFKTSECLQQENGWPCSDTSPVSTQQAELCLYFNKNLRVPYKCPPCVTAWVTFAVRTFLNSSGRIKTGYWGLSSAVNKSLHH